MEYLPEEMVSQIGQLLSEEDLAACCAVSLAWRDAFNRDVIWRNRCDADLVQYLRDTKCFVEPTFVSPEVPDSGLSDVCEWRQNYMRQNHLYNNWRQGRYHTVLIPTKLDSMQIRRCVFYGSDFAVLSGFVKQKQDETRIQLWEITSKITRNPRLLSEYTVPLPVPLHLHHDIGVSENSVFSTHGDVIEVLSITNSLELQFKHAFHLTQSERILVENLDLTECIANNYNKIVGPTLVAISNLPNVNKSKMLVWNVETGEKLKEKMYEDCLLKICRHEGSKENNRVAVIAKKSNLAGAAYKVLIYDLTKLVFHPFSAISSQCLPADCLLHNKLIAVKFATNLNIYNIATEKLVFNLSTNLYTHCKIFRNRIIFNYNRTLQLFNPLNSTAEILFTLPGDNCDIKLIAVHRKKFILFDKIQPDMTTYETYFLEDKLIKIMRPLPFKFKDLAKSEFLFTPRLIDIKSALTILYW